MGDPPGCAARRAARRRTTLAQGGGRAPPCRRNPLTRRRRPGDADSTVGPSGHGGPLMRTIRPRSRLALIIAVMLVRLCGLGRSMAPAGQPAGGGHAGRRGSGSGEGQGAARPPPAAPTVGTPDDGVGAAVDDARIIRTGSIDLEVTDVPPPSRRRATAIRAMGGYVGASADAGTMARRRSPRSPTASRPSAGRTRSTCSAASAASPRRSSASRPRPSRSPARSSTSRRASGTCGRARPRSRRSPREADRRSPTSSRSRPS